jgi:protein-L-isoaspartate(D-aspartate) O-methyltransferase
MQTYAYEDVALGIGRHQTISQPFVVAIMTSKLLAQRQCHKILEIGTGSGYQAAVLSYLVDEVYSIERIRELQESASEHLAKLNIQNVFLRHANGKFGWPEQAPFDGIIVTAAAPEVPTALKQQLADGGRLIIPVDFDHVQRLQVITRQGSHFHFEELDYVMFVPLLPGEEE